MSTYAEVLNAALSLPVQERTELADVLLASTDVDDDTGFEMSAAWREEIARRSAEYDRGEVQAIPWDQVREEARRKHRGNA